MYQVHKIMCFVVILHDGVSTICFDYIIRLCYCLLSPRPTTALMKFILLSKTAATTAAIMSTKAKGQSWGMGKPALADHSSFPHAFPESSPNSPLMFHWLEPKRVTTSSSKTIRKWSHYCAHCHPNEIRVPVLNIRSPGYWLDDRQSDRRKELNFIMHQLPARSFS